MSSLSKILSRSFGFKFLGAANACNNKTVSDGWICRGKMQLCEPLYVELERVNPTRNWQRIMNSKHLRFCVSIYLWGHCEVITSWTAAQHKDRIMGSAGTETAHGGAPVGRNEWSFCCGDRVPGSTLQVVVCAIVHTGMLWFSLEHYCVGFSRMPETLVLYCPRPFVFQSV